MEKDTVTLNEEEGEDTYGDEGHAVELVTPDSQESTLLRGSRRKSRERLHVEIDVRTTTAKDTMSVMARLIGAVEELTSPTDVGDVSCHTNETCAFSPQMILDNAFTRE